VKRRARFNDTVTPMRIVLVRHGETTGESSIRYHGVTDVLLSPLGEEQMRRAGAALAYERFDAVLSSRLQRARRGAELVARRAPQPVAAFDEVDFGRWEGWTRAEIAARDPENFRRWQVHPETFVYPGGDCRQVFARRVAAGLGALLADPPGETVLLVGHRGVIAVMLAELLGLPPAARRALAIDLGSIHIVARHAAAWQAEVLNRIDHLDGEPPRAAGAEA
jgi:broad specificity phosphatase PhoE